MRGGMAGAKGGISAFCLDIGVVHAGQELTHQAGVVVLKPLGHRKFFLQDPIAHGGRFQVPQELRGLDQLAVGRNFQVLERVTCSSIACASRSQSIRCSAALLSSRPIVIS